MTLTNSDCIMDGKENKPDDVDEPAIKKKAQESPTEKQAGNEITNTLHTLAETKANIYHIHHFILLFHTITTHQYSEDM